MTTTLAKNIKQIPPLPDTIQEINRVHKDPDSTLEDMQHAIEKDPLLTAEILRIINSPMYGVKSTITSIKQAVSLLGKDTIRTFAMSSIANSFTIDLSPYGMSAQEFSTACFKQLALTINWIARRKPAYLSIIGPASFLVDLGRVIISQTLIEDEKTSIIEQALLSGEDIASAEKTACGVQTTDVTATLFYNWNFDPELIHIIRYSDDPEGTHGEEREMAAILKVIRETVMPNGEITEDSIAVAKDTIEEFDLDLEGYERALDRMLEN